MAALDVVSASPCTRSAAKRLLVVEDESLIAMVLADQIAELGHTIVGPACTLMEARQLAAAAPLDGALLDLNVRGALSYEIADILSGREIPFVFITGYDQPPTGAYVDVGILRKPFALTGLTHTIESMLMTPPNLC
jgi:CheY-like chemotaxis protein